MRETKTLEVIHSVGSRRFARGKVTMRDANERDVLWSFESVEGRAPLPSLSPPRAPPSAGSFLSPRPSLFSSLLFFFFLFLFFFQSDWISYDATDQKKRRLPSHRSVSLHFSRLQMQTITPADDESHTSLTPH